MKQQRTIGVMQPMLLGHYFRGIISGIHAIAREQGVRCLVFQGNPRDFLECKAGWEHVDGWVVVLESDGMADVPWGDVPVVTVDMRLPESNYCGVLPDNEGGTRAAVAHLIEHGHTRIGFAGWPGQSNILERLAGYRAELEAHGIPFDPQLVFEATDNTEVGGHHAAQQFLAAGSPCTAMVVATDLNAIALIETVQAAGCRVPEDLAVIGFDNVASAKYMSPPLSTVAQHFAELGSAAARRLLALISSEPVPRGTIRVPTGVIPRDSCGCAIASMERVTRFVKHDTAADWQAAAALNLLRLARYPLQTSETDAPEALAACRQLVGALHTALEGSDPPARRDIEHAWRTVASLASDAELLQLMMQVLTQAATQQLAARPQSDAMRQRVDEFLRQASVDLIRAQHVAEQSWSGQQNALVYANQTIGLRLLSDDPSEAQKLGWLSGTPVRWACLGLWESLPEGRRLRLAGTYSADGDLLPATDTYYAAERFPAADALPASVRQGLELLLLLQVKTADRSWGVLALAVPMSGYYALTLEWVNTWATMLGSALARMALIASLTEQQETLRAGYEREHALSQTVRELGCPVIPILSNVLLVPLIGVIDADRAQSLLEAVLHGIERARATTVLVDITAVPLIDTQVANVLIMLARSAALLGSRLVLVGIRPEIAQGIVGLGIDLSTLMTQPTLAAAIESMQQSPTNGVYRV